MYFLLILLLFNEINSIRITSKYYPRSANNIHYSIEKPFNYLADKIPNSL